MVLVFRSDLFEFAVCYTGENVMILVWPFLCCPDFLTVEQRSGNIFWYISKTALSVTLRQ